MKKRRPAAHMKKEKIKCGCGGIGGTINENRAKEKCKRKKKMVQ